MVLRAIEQGAPLARLELWHHEIDGREGSTLMDWPCTAAYCRAFASTFGVPLYTSWKRGGFEGELLRENMPTAPNMFETPDDVGMSGGRGSSGTRRRFPQLSSDLSVRWCSAYLKIDVGAAAIRNQPRFRGKRVLVLSGERAAESPCRAGYAVFESHRTDLRNRRRYQRHIDHHRPVHGLSDAEVWEILRRWRINPHPAYQLGWGRCSCAGCIFGSANQWASLRAVNPAQFNRIAAYEQQFGTTIRRAETLVQAADRGRPFAAITRNAMRAALSDRWDAPIIVPVDQEWILPPGAMGDRAGPM